MWRADIEWHERRSAEEDRPEPDGQVGGIEVGAAGGAVAVDLDGMAGEDVADEIADGEVLIEG